MGGVHHVDRRGGRGAGGCGGDEICERLRHPGVLRLRGDRLRRIDPDEDPGRCAAELETGAGSGGDGADSRPGHAALVIHRDEICNGRAGRTGDEERTGSGGVGG